MSVKAVEVLGHAFDVEDWPGHEGARLVAGELNRGAYGLAGLSLGPGGVFVDVGAHIGLVSMAAAAMHPGARVVALEPHPATFGLLRRNLDRNGMAAVEALCLGVSGDGGPRVLSCPPESVGPSSWLTRNVVRPAVRIETVTLPGLFARLGLGRCDVLKLDIEGAEHEAILACGPEFFARVGRLVVEVHAGARLEAAGFTPGRLLRHLEACGVDFAVTGEPVRFCD